MIQDQLALVHANAISIESGILRVDRKFHLGMLHFASQMKLPCCTLNPQAVAGQRIMDQIEVPIAELPYRIESVTVDGFGLPVRDGLARMREAIERSRLTYGTG